MDDILHPLITELHEGMRARNWRAEDVLDLANAITARDAVPPVSLIGPLTTHLRGANGATIAQVRAMAEEALRKGSQATVRYQHGLRPAAPAPAS